MNILSNSTNSTGCLNCIVLSIEINIFPESEELCKLYNLNILNTITSGSLLICLDEKDSDDLVNLLQENNINANVIGTIVPKDKGLKILKDGKKTTLSYSEIDEITKIF